MRHSQAAETLGRATQAGQPERALADQPAPVSAGLPVRGSVGQPQRVSAGLLVLASADQRALGLEAQPERALGGPLELGSVELALAVLEAWDRVASVPWAWGRGQGEVQARLRPCK